MIQIMDRFMISLFYDAFARFLFAGWYQMNDYFLILQFVLCLPSVYQNEKKIKIKIRSLIKIGNYNF